MTTSTKERGFLIAVLSIIFILVVGDLMTDSAHGIRWWHLVLEGTMACLAATGIFYLVRGTFQLQRSLEEEKMNVSHYRAAASQWREQSLKYIEGLSKAIDEQLNHWHLTQSEKEVALLLLKGLSSKEIAEIRKTAEKTVRLQCGAIYSKAGLAGRSELAAFFLEDLLSANTHFSEKEIR